MSDSIPEYYRHLAQQGEPSAEHDDPEARGSSTGAKEASAAGESEMRRYRADAFRLHLPPDEWHDRSVYTLTGPTVDGIQHNITINIEPDPEVDTLDAFAEQQVAALEPSLDGCRVLMEDRVALESGQPAHRVIFFWYPEDDLRLYQEQLYVLHDGRGYTLTASFTRKTRKQLGPEVEQMMLSFSPAVETS